MGGFFFFPDNNGNWDLGSGQNTADKTDAWLENGRRELNRVSKTFSFHPRSERSNKWRLVDKSPAPISHHRKPNSTDTTNIPWLWFYIKLQSNCILFYQSNFLHYKTDYTHFPFGYTYTIPCRNIGRNPFFSLSPKPYHYHIISIYRMYLIWYE